MRKSVGEMLSRLYREYADLSNEQMNMARELRELREEVALLKSATENRTDPCGIFSINGAIVGRISNNT